ncbi:MAG TPA: hypothetical protein ENI70_01910 [Candidatus Peregrinibacteria bacterium]|nr:hypothetical protein [Candidatus Peregrinibacteria bacterium]
MTSNKKTWSRFYISVILVGFFIWSLFGLLPDQLLHLNILESQGGETVLITTPANQKILINGGEKTKVLEELGKELNFFENTIDLLILTNPQESFVEGLVEVVKRYTVKKVLLTGINYPNEVYEEFLKLLDENQIPLEIAQGNKDYQLEKNIYLDILHPLESIAGKKLKPSQSVVITKLTYGETSALLVGNITKEISLKQLQTDLDLSADLLVIDPQKASPDFLAAVNARQILTSTEAGKLISNGREWQEAR